MNPERPEFDVYLWNDERGTDGIQKEEI